MKLSLRVASFIIVVSTVVFFTSQVTAKSLKRNSRTAPNSIEIGARISTLGIGAEVGYKVSKNIRFRVVSQAYNYSSTFEETDITYDGNVDLMTAGGLIDWHPFSGSFKVTGGAYHNGNSVDFTANPTGTVTIGDGYYTQDDIGSITGDVEFDTFAPYFGIGWGNAFKGSNWTISLELGAMYQGKGTLTYVTNGTLADDQTIVGDEFRKNIETEKQELQDKIDEYEFYPVVALGLSYSF